MKFAFIAKNRHIWPVSWLYNALEVSRSGFHAWLNRPACERAIHDEKLGAAIRTSFKASDRTYGARRVWRDVLEEGLACGLHRVERLMRENGYRARPKRRAKPKNDGERAVIADNILDRDFAASRPNQKWLADFTYIWTAEGCRGSGPFLPAHRWLVNDGGTRCSPGHGCPDDGGMAARQSRRASASL